MTIECEEIDLLTRIARDLSGYSDEQVKHIQEVFVKHISYQVDQYLKDKENLLPPPASVADLFNGILNGTIAEIQNFSKDKKVGRRVYTKKVDQGDGVIRYQPCVRNRDGKEEEWNITIDNLNRGYWVEIPSPDDFVGFGVALESLFMGYCDYIRCDDFQDSTLYLKRGIVIHDDGHYPVLKKVNDNTQFFPSPSTQASRRWFMIKLPKE